jgi:hypothetical protein
MTLGPYVAEPFNRRSREDAISRKVWYENVTKPDSKHGLTLEMHYLRKKYPTLSMADLALIVPKRYFY